MRIRSMWYTALVLVLGLLSILATPTMGLAVDSRISAQAIYNQAASYAVGTRVGDGECKTFANTVFNTVAAAKGSGARLGGGYYTDFKNAGGVRVTYAQAVPGDIVQLNKSTDPDHYYPGMHTAVIAQYGGNGSFYVIDSNLNDAHVVAHHVFNAAQQAADNDLVVNIWRLGTVDKTKPTGKIDSPLPGQIVLSPGSTTVKGTFSDSSGIAKVQLRWRYEDEPKTAYRTLKNEDTNGKDGWAITFANHSFEASRAVILNMVPWDTSDNSNKDITVRIVPKANKPASGRSAEPTGTLVSGLYRDITFSGTDLDGAADIAKVSLMIGPSSNYASNWPSTIFMTYEKSTNKLYLYDGKGVATSGVVGTSTVLTNTQADVDLSRTFVTATDNDLVITVRVRPHLSGTKTTFVRAVDAPGWTSAFMNCGGVTLMNRPPAVASVVPSTGTLPSGSFTPVTLTATDPDSAEQVRWLRFIIGPDVNLAVWSNKIVMHVNGAGVVTLWNKAGASVTGKIGEARVLQSDTCWIDLQSSSLTRDGNEFAATLSIRPRITGTFKAYVCVKDEAMSATADIKKGAFTVPLNYAVGSSFTPTGSVVSGLYRDFAFGGTDLDGAADIAKVTVVIGPSSDFAANWSSTIYMTYEKSTNRLYLRDAKGTATSGVLGSPVVLSNSQADVDLLQTMVAVSGNRLIITARVRPHLVGVKTLFVRSVDGLTGTTSPFRSCGSLALTNAAPKVGSVTPTSGILPSGSFSPVTFTASDADSAAQLRWMRLTVGPDSNLAVTSNKIIITVNGAGNVSLCNKAGVVSTGTVGEDRVMQTDTCWIDLRASSITAIGNALTATLAVRPRITGILKSYIGARDQALVVVPDVQRGTLTVR